MDNEQEVRGSLEEYFGRHGQELKLNLKVWTFFSGSQFLAERMPFDLVCLDIEMPEMNGLELAAKIRFLRRNPCRLRLFNGFYLGKFRSGSGGGAFCKMQGMDDKHDDFRYVPKKQAAGRRRYLFGLFPG